MSAQSAERIDAILNVENALARALEAQAHAVELRLALNGAARRGGYFAPENVPVALAALPVIEQAISDHLDRLRTERGELRNGNVPHE